MPRNREFCDQTALQKAMQLFWAKGYHATSIQDLVDHLGINRASMYNTYGDKRALFQKSLDFYKRSQSEELQSFLQSHPNPVDGLKALFGQAIEESQSESISKGCFMVNATTELASQDPEIAEFLTENQTSVQSFFEDYLKHAKAKGELKSDLDPTVMASLLFTLYNGIQVVSKLNPDTKRMQASVDEVLGLMR